MNETSYSSHTADNLKFERPLLERELFLAAIESERGILGELLGQLNAALQRQQPEDPKTKIIEFCCSKNSKIGQVWGKEKG